MNGAEEKKKKCLSLQGIVASDKMQKTIVVAVTRYKKHPRYGKYVRVTKKYKAHDEKGEAKTGDIVLIREVRPMSKDKHFVLARIVSKGRGADSFAPPESGDTEAGIAFPETESPLV